MGSGKEAKRGKRGKTTTHLECGAAAKCTHGRCKPLVSALLCQSQLQRCISRGAVELRRRDIHELGPKRTASYYRHVSQMLFSSKKLLFTFFYRFTDRMRRFLVHMRSHLDRGTSNQMNISSVCSHVYFLFCLSSCFPNARKYLDILVSFYMYRLRVEILLQLWLSVSWHKLSLDHF